MMFMIPTPPTSSEMPTMPLATSVIAAATLCELIDELLHASMRKLFGPSDLHGGVVPHGEIPISALASSELPPGSGCWRRRSFHDPSSRACEMGQMHFSVAAPLPNMDDSARFDKPTTTLIRRLADHDVLPVGSASKSKLLLRDRSLIDADRTRLRVVDERERPADRDRAILHGVPVRLDSGDLDVVLRPRCEIVWRVIRLHLRVKCPTDRGNVPVAHQNRRGVKTMEILPTIDLPTPGVRRIGEDEHLVGAKRFKFRKHVGLEARERRDDRRHRCTRR